MQFKISFTMRSGNVYNYVAAFDSREVCANAMRTSLARSVVSFDDEDIIACTQVERVQIAEYKEPVNDTVRPVLPEVPESDRGLGKVPGRKGR